MKRFQKTMVKILDDLPKKNIIYLIKAYYLNPSFKLLFLFRIGKYFSESKFKISRVISSFIRIKIIKKFSCDISFKSQIGSKCKFAHPIGIVIGANVIIKEHVTIYQNVTIGSHGKINVKKNYPVINNNVVIYSNSVLIGGITVSENAVIGASSFVNKDIPENCTAFGNPIEIKYKKK